MWIYSETVATSAHATEYRAVTSSSSFTSEVVAAPGLSVTSSVDAVEQRSLSINEYGRTERSEGRTDILSTYSDSIGSSTASSWRSSSYETVAGFTQSSSASTSANQGAATTTASGSTAGVRTRETYVSGTQSTTQAVIEETTTTRTTTRSVVSTAAGPTTASAAQTYTETVSTTAAGIGTTTMYLTAASASLTAPEMLVPVTVAEVSEQLWEVSATVESAGFAEHVASTRASRTGTLATHSTALPIASQATSTRAAWTAAVSTLTLDTTATLTASDTYVPYAGVLPATATATRAVTLLTLVSTTLSYATRATAPTTVSGATSLFSTSAATQRRLTTGSVPVTYNLSPTATASGSFHATWWTVDTWEAFSPTPAHGTSATADGTFSASTVSGVPTVESTSSTFTTTETQGTSGTATTETTSVAPNGSTAETLTASASADLSYGPFSSTDESEDASENVTYSASVSWSYVIITLTTEATTGSTTLAGGVGTVFSTTESAQFFTRNDESSISETSWTISPPASATAFNIVTDQSIYGGATVSGTASSTYSLTPDTYTTTTTISGSYTIEVTDTETGTRNTLTTATGTGLTTTSSSGAQSISWTGYALGAAAAIADTQAWTALAMHPRAGFRLPTGLAASDAVLSSLGLSGLGSLAWSWRATQDDSAGPVVPIAHTDEVCATTGSTVITGVWRTSDSLLHVTTGVSETYSTTEQAGTSTASYTRTRTSATSTATAGITAAAGRTWYIPQSTAAASAASSIGGIPQASRYGLVIYQPPGVRHVTRQSAGGSSSSSTWETFLGFPTGSTFGEAYPTRTESAWSVVPALTSWKLYESGTSLLTESSGATVKPLLTLSLNPNL